VVKWFNSLIDILTVAIPMMDSSQISTCLSTTLNNRKLTWKEAVWQNHFFASLYTLLPKKYSLSPEYPPDGTRASVDYRIHSEGFKGSVEWLITELSSTNKLTSTIKDYIFDHYYRFVPDPKGKFPQTYKRLSQDPFVVVNVTHTKSNIKIPDCKPQTYVEMVIDDNFTNVDLYFDDHHIPLKIGTPVLYDLELRTTKPFRLEEYTPFVTNLGTSTQKKLM